ncbi:hypothetical protein AgCh_000313 [Apium graveolens]
MIRWLRTAAVDDINTVVLDGMYPLHLAVFTPSTDLLSDLIEHYGANPNVKCSDANSPFNEMTPLEMALHLITMPFSLSAHPCPREEVLWCS